MTLKHYHTIANSEQRELVIGPDADQGYSFSLQFEAPHEAGYTAHHVLCLMQESLHFFQQEHTIEALTTLINTHNGLH